MGKQKTSGYATFADENKRRFKGWNNRMSFSELLKIADPYWKEVSPEEKERWHKHARMLNDQIISSGSKMETSCHRLDVEGVVITEHNRPPVVPLHEDTLEDILDATPEIDLNFIIVDTILFVDYDDGEVLPAEFGFVRASLAEGVIDEIHFIVDPRDIIKSGYQSNAKESSERHHKIPTFGKVLNDIVAGTDYEIIGTDLKELIEDARSGLFLCRKEQLGKVNSALKWLCEKTRLEQFQVYPIEDFIQKLSKPVDVTVGQITLKLDGGEYDHESSIRCPFHANLDTIGCARKNAHKYFYLTAALLNDHYEFELIEGKHRPVDQPPITYTYQRRQNRVQAVRNESPSLLSSEPQDEEILPQNDRPRVPRTPTSLSNKQRGGGACGGSACGGVSDRSEEKPTIPRMPISHSNRGNKKSYLPKKEDDLPTAPEIPRAPSSHSNKKMECLDSSKPRVNLANDNTLPVSHHTNPTITALPDTVIPRKPKSCTDKSKDCTVIPNLGQYTYDIQSYNTTRQLGPPPGLPPPSNMEFTPPGLNAPPPGFGPIPRYAPSNEVQRGSSAGGRRGRSRERSLDSRGGSSRGRDGGRESREEFSQGRDGGREGSSQGRTSRRTRTYSDERDQKNS